VTPTSDDQSNPARRPLALVTGASAGIGEQFARSLASRGYDLILVARRRSVLESLAKELKKTNGGRAEVLVADLTDSTQLAVVENKLSRSRRIDLLVNDAGVGAFGEFSSSDRARQEEEIRLNILAVVRLTHAVIPGMLRRKHGAIINVSSTASLAPCPSFATYGATKAFMNSFTEGVAEELRGTGVRLQALCPGLTHTQIFEQAGADVSSLPDLFWMEPVDVVNESLDALKTDKVIVIPGLGNKALSVLISLLPKAASTKIAEVIGRNFILPTQS
jgi:short-subunit dehydrogenase